MCTPQAAAIFQVIGTVAQFSARQQQVQMENAQREQARLNAAIARDIQSSQLAIRVKQEQDVRTQKQIDKQIEVLEKKSKSKLGNLEAGVAGRMLATIMNDYDRKALTSATNFRAENENLAQQYFWRLQGLDAQAENRVNQNQPLPMPSPFLILADIGMTMAEYQQNQERADYRNEPIRI